MDIELIEQETARMHRQFVEDGQCDSYRMRDEKRTISDNNRSSYDLK